MWDRIATIINEINKVLKFLWKNNKITIENSRRKINSLFIVVECEISLGSNAIKDAPNNPKYLPKNFDEIK